MGGSKDYRRIAAQRLRELFPKASGWEETVDVKIAGQPVDLEVKFMLGASAHHLLLQTTSLGQPRQIRQAIGRLDSLRRAAPAAYPVAVADYIGPQSASLIKRAGFGYLDLSGNCHLSFEHVLIDREGKPNQRASSRPLRSLFAPRATRVLRVLLVDPQHGWRLEELAKAAEVSLGHAHNVVKRLVDLRWAERAADQRIHLLRPAELLDGWAEVYTYQRNEVNTFYSPERVTRQLMAEVARACHAEGRYAFTLHSGAALVASSIRSPAIHCYVEGNPEAIARGLGLRSGEGEEGNVHLLVPYDSGVFYAPIAKGGLPVVSLPQIYLDLYHYERRGREVARNLRREAMGY